MAQKRATLIVFRSDRNLWTGRDLRLRIISLFDSGGPRVLTSRSIPPTVELDLDLPFDAGQAYGISIDADRHRSAWHVLTRRSFLRQEGSTTREVDATILRLMLAHNQAQPSDLAVAYRALEAQGSPFATFGAPRFNQLGQAPAKLAFLNLEAKLRETRIGTRSLLSFVRDVREVAVDRVFLLVSAELRALVEDSAEFADAPGHGVPSAFPNLPAHPDSWKHTKFDFGNLQLSFSSSTVLRPGGPGNAPERCFSVDCDVDLERDLGHAFEFIFNAVFDRKTDQTLVYRMLFDQNILPSYTLVPPETEEAVPRVGVRLAAPHPQPAARPAAPRRRPTARGAGARSARRAAKPSRKAPRRTRRGPR